MTTKSISTSYLANYITKLLHNVLLLNEIIFVLKVLKITQILTDSYVVMFKNTCHSYRRGHMNSGELWKCFVIFRKQLSMWSPGLHRSLLCKITACRLTEFNTTLKNLLHTFINHPSIPLFFIV